MVAYLAQGLTLPAMADFVGPYALTPPQAGKYSIMAASSMKFGAWGALGMARALNVDTSQSPTTLILDTEEVSRGGGGFIQITAQDSGTVRFTYALEGVGNGFFIWQIGSSSGVITNLNSQPAEISAQIKTGEVVTWQVSASGTDRNDGSGSGRAQRRATITGFEAPIAGPTIRIKQSGQKFRIAPDQSIRLFTEAALVNAVGELTFQWEKNGTNIPGATQSQNVEDQSGLGRIVTILSVSGDLPGTTNRYRVIVKAGALEVPSPPVQVITVLPAEPRLLLHLDFEDTVEGRFTDSTGQHSPVAIGEIPIVRGRVGRAAANFSGSGYLQIPAAGTDLELVGSPYTIAFWIAPLTNRQQQQLIYNLAAHDEAVAGWGEAGMWIHTDLAGYLASAGGAISAWHRDGADPVDTLLTASWQHCAIVYDGVARTLYVNGRFRSSVASPSAVAGSGQDDLFIAPVSPQLPPGDQQALGLLDDFRIYNYALTAEAIAAVASVSPPPPRLSIEIEGGLLTIKWPVINGPNYRLESSSFLDSHAEWNPLSSPVLSAGEYYEATPPLENGASYYRIRAL